MSLPIRPPFAPMEAELVGTIPVGDEWQYEPKWDGFRCVVFRDGDDVMLQSKKGQALARYFPEVVAQMQRLRPQQFVIDGELVVPVGEQFSFDDLLQRIHPAATRVAKLAAEHPAIFIVFDLLVDADGTPLLAQPLRTRRRALERFAERHLTRDPAVRLSPATTDPNVALAWLEAAGNSIDGVVAKILDAAYRSGERSAMQKVKIERTADCVVGGFRYASHGRAVGSLLLGLYDDNGLLHHVGFCAGFRADERKALLPQLESLIARPGFTGSAPGGPSRWSTKRSTEWEPLKPRLVAEVGYDHYTGGRFRHGTRLIRWRPDKAPKQCTLEQVEQEHHVAALKLLRGAPHRAKHAAKRARQRSKVSG